MLFELGSDFEAGFREICRSGTYSKINLFSIFGRKPSFFRNERTIVPQSTGLHCDRQRSGNSAIPNREGGNLLKSSFQSLMGRTKRKTLCKYYRCNTQRCPGELTFSMQDPIPANTEFSLPSLTPPRSKIFSSATKSGGTIKFLCKILPLSY